MGLEVFGAALIIMLSSLVGVIFLQKTAERFLEEKLGYLISFSAGVFLVTAGALMLEVFELASSLWMGAGIIGLGYVIASLVHALIPESHHHHASSCEHEHGVAARKLIIGDGIHNIADGVLIVAAFSVSPALGLAATVSIIIHEVLQEISEFFVLRRAGYSVRKALAVNFLVSSTILIGVVLGYYAIASHELETLLLGLSAGFFLHVVWHDLLPKKSEQEGTRTFLTKLALVVVGALLMGIIGTALSEGHVHGGDSAHGHDEHEEGKGHHEDHSKDHDDHNKDHEDHDEHAEGVQ